MSDQLFRDAWANLKSRLFTKTSWGRNEIMAEMAEALEQAAIHHAMNHVDHPDSNPDPDQEEG